MFQRASTYVIASGTGAGTWIYDTIENLNSVVGLFGAIIAVVSGLIAIAIQWPKFMECPFVKWVRSLRRK